MSLDADIVLFDSLQLIKSVDENKQTVYYFKVLKSYYDYNIKKYNNFLAGVNLVVINSDETGKYYIISLEEMKNFLEAIYMFIQKYFLPRFSKETFNLGYDCIIKLNDLYHKLNFIYSTTITTIDNKSVMDFIDYISAIHDVLSNFSYFNELCLNKDVLLHSLEYFCTAEELKYFDDVYRKALVDCDIPKLKLILKNTQNEIIKQWTGATTNIGDYKSGMPFKLLCHSVESPYFYGDFRTKYVSASLLTDKLMDTINEEYGFILEPSNIVAASDDDMDTYNNADDINDLYYNSAILPVQGPEEVLENCYKRRVESPRITVYSEIVLEGFKPIGIFAITDGSKEINPNYVAAYKLQEKFPDLQVIEIDKTLYFIEERDKHIFLRNLINNIASYKEAKKIKIRNNSSLPIDFYNEFWQEFMELKKNNDYTIGEIIKLFDKSDDLLFEIDIDNLFLQYSDLELHKILNYSLYLGTCNLVFNKCYGKVEFNKVYEQLKKYAGDTRLDMFVPGLSMFLTLMGMIPNLPINEWYKINKASNLEQINIILARAVGIDYEPDIVSAKENTYDNDSQEDTTGCRLVFKFL